MGRITNVLDEAWDAAIEAAAEACELEAKVFASEQYATGQPLSSAGERFACSTCANSIRALKRRSIEDQRGEE
jgi:hypothetical protein